MSKTSVCLSVNTYILINPVCLSVCLSVSRYTLCVSPDGSGSPPRKQVDESPVLTYISELHNHLVKQFPDISDSESEPQTKCVHGLKLLPLESWIIEGEGLVKEEPDLGVEGEDSDASPLISKIEVRQVCCILV